MMHTQIPIVRLRELMLEDIEDRYQWCLDKEVTKHLNVPEQYPPFSREETENWIKLCMSKKNGYEQRAILDEHGKHIGWIDLKQIDLINEQAELGIAIGDRNYWGKGYGLAAMKAMLQYGFTELNLNKIWLRVDFDNAKAIKSYRRMGYVEEGVLRQDRKRKGEFIDRLRMSILKEEFLSLNQK